MTLRTRLTLGLTVLLTVMILSLGAVAVRSAERVLVGQIDTNLVEIANRFAPASIGDIVGGRGPFRQTYAVVVLDADGDVVASAPSGFEGEPDPLPDTTDLQAPVDRRATLATLGAVSGDGRYRALVANGPRATTVVVAEPLRDVEAATRRLLRATVLGGIVVLGIGAGVTWWTVRRETAAIDDMVDAAGGVASGQLGRRVSAVPAATELATLKDALNDMFRRNERAFETERATQERLRRFVADASHELRTPITAISGYAQLHRMGGLEDAEARNAAMTRIEAETERMERLVADLMLLARLDEHRAPDRRAVALGDVVHDAVADHSTVDGDRPVEVGDIDATVWADPDALTQVLANLLANVRAHTPPGTTVRIDVEPEGSTVLLHVTDDGPGVDGEHLPHLFDRFYRAQDPRRRSGSGSGLGLAIAAGLVEAMGGTIEAVEAPFGGLRVTVRLERVDNGIDDNGGD